MVKPNKILLSWSGGKDSALVYKQLKKSGYENISLFTFLNISNDRVSHHGVSKSLIDKQAKSLGLKIHYIRINNDIIFTINETKKFITNFKEYTFVYGDIYLQNVKDYRDNIHSNTNTYAIYPLWGKNILEIANEVKQCMKAILININTKYLNELFLGKDFSECLFPRHVDPCGENGEFHTFVYEFQYFTKPIKIELKEKYYNNISIYQNIAINK